MWAAMKKAVADDKYSKNQGIISRNLGFQRGFHDWEVHEDRLVCKTAKSVLEEAKEDSMNWNPGKRGKFYVSSCY